jgi:hypothetical protein
MTTGNRRESRVLPEPRPYSPNHGAVSTTHHFVVDSTNYFVEHGAVLLAALRLLAEPRQKDRCRSPGTIDSANAATLENTAEELLKVTVLMNSMPACSLKALLTHLHASCTTHSTSHGRASSRAETSRFVPSTFSTLLESLDTGQIHNRPQWRQPWRVHTDRASSAGRSAGRPDICPARITGAPSPPKSQWAINSSSSNGRRSTRTEISSARPER